MFILADRETLRAHYGSQLEEGGLPSLVHMESRERMAIQAALSHATRKCANAYAKGKRSFQIVGKLVPAVLRDHLPSFARIERILEARL